MDVLYPVKEYEYNPELRYSLRSLQNLPHDKVFMCGFRPSWVSGKVLSMERQQENKADNKYVKALKNLIAACHDPRLSENFILMNDDFFVIKPVVSLQAMHMGLLNDQINHRFGKYPSAPYTHGMIATFHRLQNMGIEDPLCYEVHVPMVVNKEKFLEALEIAIELDGFGKRTIYGNLNKIGGELIEDVKFTNPRKPIFDYMQFVSTDEGSFNYHPIGGYIRGLFQLKSEYEREPM